MSDDWQKLGDVVRGIAERLEGVMIARPPVAQADADLFLMLLTEIYGPLPQGAARRKDGPAK